MPEHASAAPPWPVGHVSDRRMKRCSVDADIWSMTLRLRTLRQLIALTLLASLLVVGLRPATAAAATPGEIRNSLERKINAARAERGLRRLRVNDTIQRYAQDHAGLMADLNSMFHDAAYFSEVPGDSMWAAENVGYVPAGSGAARRMHRAFMNSAGHRANILTARATHMGLGVVKHDGRVWVVERFADRS